MEKIQNLDLIDFCKKIKLIKSVNKKQKLIIIQKKKMKYLVHTKINFEETWKNKLSNGWKNWLSKRIPVCIYIYIYHHHHHHHVVPPAQISLTLSRHSSLSLIASGRSSGLHPVSSHSCCMYVRAGSPAFARPYVGVHRRTSLMSSFLLLQQCPACLVRLALIVFVMGGRWPYSWCFVGCRLQDLLKIARSILM